MNMSILKKTRTPLIVDPDQKFLDSLQIADHPTKIQPKVAINGSEAQLLLSDANQSFSAVFLNPRISYPGGISVIRCSKLNKPGTPIYLIYDETPIFKDSELKSLGIQKQIPKPLTFDEILSYIAPAALYFNSDMLVTHVKKETLHQLDTSVTVEDSKFVSIRATDFLSGTICYFDLYVRLNSNKYVKIVQAGDRFQTERVTAYLEKGVHFFYISKESQEYYLGFCDRLSTSLLKRSDIPTEIKMSQVMNHGEETLKFLKTQGMNETNVKYAAQFLENVHSLVKTINPGKSPVLKKFLTDITSYDHAVGVTTIAAMLIPGLDITSASPVETIGLGAFFHDIGLTKLGISSEDTTKMSPDEWEKFKTHPILGSEIVSHLDGFKPSVIQSVLQHHERRNKKGFPFQLGPGSISLISEIIGISDEFFKILIKLKAGEKFDLPQEMKQNIFDCFSHKLLIEFKNVFFFTGSGKK